MANNRNFSNILLENIGNQILITFDFTGTTSKEAAETTALPVCSKSPINDSPANISERFTYHLQQQVLFLQTELKNKSNYIKRLLLQLSKQSNIIYYFQNQSNHKHIRNTINQDKPTDAIGIFIRQK